MTSEILQLFPQALEMLISWSSFDCILDSRTCNLTYRTITVKPMKTTLYNTLWRISTQWVLNGPVQFTAVLHLKRLFILLAGWSGVLFDEMHTIVQLLQFLGGRYLRCGGSVVFHKSDCRQLLAELLQHNHTLEQSDVVNEGAFRFQAKQSLSD